MTVPSKLCYEIQNMLYVCECVNMCTYACVCTRNMWKGTSIKYVRKIFRKTNISNPLIHTLCVRIRGLEMLVFWKILHTYLMDDPKYNQLKISPK